ncbi:MAG: helix-turn-helix domain-containing protein [Thermoguttaceae bacterium]
MTSPNVRVFPLNLLPSFADDSVSRQFFVGDENAVVAAVIESFTSSSVSPLVIVGASGLGKTHLATGLWSLWSEAHPQLRGVYLTGSDFVRELNAAVTARHDDEWRQRLRSAALVVIDGLEEVLSRPHATNELVPLIDEAARRGHRVVVTLKQFRSVASPLIESRLAARLSEGLVVALAPPSHETRLRYLHAIAPAIRGDFDAALLAVLAEELPLTFPQLRGAAMRIGERFRASKVKTPESLRQIVREEYGGTCPSLGVIARRVARSFRVTQRDLKGSSRRRQIATARGVAVYLSRQLTTKTLQEIGAFFGKRDHSTVAHLEDATQERLTHDTALRNQVDAIVLALGQNPNAT